MRVRVTQHLSGSIDGIQLSRFVIGLTYDVGTAVGNYLLAMNAAVPVESDSPALVLPIQDIAEIISQKSPLSAAADRSTRKKKTSRKRR
jgi:hypothetical protein